MRLGGLTREELVQLVQPAIQHHLGAARGRGGRGMAVVVLGQTLRRARCMWRAIVQNAGERARAQRGRRAAQPTQPYPL